MAKTARAFLTLLYAALLVGAPYWYHHVQDARYRSFRVVRPGMLYRSGQLDPEGLRDIVESYGIRTIVTLRAEDEINEGESATDRWEEEYCEANSVAFVRIPPRQWWVPDGPPPAREGVATFLDVLGDPLRYPRPILVHCFAGVHRTGVYCAIYRMECEGWPAEEALAEMKRCGYRYLDREVDVKDFVSNYRRVLMAPAKRARPLRAKMDASAGNVAQA